MKTVLRRLSLAGLAMGLFTALTGCVATSGGYEGEGGTSYSVDYYETNGYDYGHWHPEYHVAPPREHEARPPHAERHPAKPAYRPAPPSRPVPSIPSRSRSRSH